MGVLIFKFLETLTWLGTYRETLNGAGLLLILYFLPGGFGQAVFAARDRLCGGSPTAAGSSCPAWWPTSVTEGAQPLGRRDLHAGRRLCGADTTSSRSGTPIPVGAGR